MHWKNLKIVLHVALNSHCRLISHSPYTILFHRKQKPKIMPNVHPVSILFCGIYGRCQLAISIFTVPIIIKKDYPSIEVAIGKTKAGQIICPFQQSGYRHVTHSSGPWNPSDFVLCRRQLSVYTLLFSGDSSCWLRVANDLWGNSAIFVALLCRD
jgi:hypothetical protein